VKRKVHVAPDISYPMNVTDKA